MLSRLVHNRVLLLKTNWIKYRKVYPLSFLLVCFYYFITITITTTIIIITITITTTIIIITITITTIIKKGEKGSRREGDRGYSDSMASIQKPDAYLELRIISSRTSAKWGADKACRRDTR